MKTTLPGDRQGWNRDADNVVRNGRRRGYILRRDESGRPKVHRTQASKTTRIIKDEGRARTNVGEILKAALDQQERREQP